MCVRMFEMWWSVARARAVGTHTAAPLVPLCRTYPTSKDPPAAFSAWQTRPPVDLCVLVCVVCVRASGSSGGGGVIDRQDSARDFCSAAASCAQTDDNRTVSNFREPSPSPCGGARVLRELWFEQLAIWRASHTHTTNTSTCMQPSITGPSSAFSSSKSSVTSGSAIVAGSPQESEGWCARETDGKCACQSVCVCWQTTRGLARRCAAVSCPGAHDAWRRAEARPS